MKLESLNLHHLRYFVDAASGMGISAAARKNFVTQSAVSRAIASLEQDIGVALVLHRQSRFQLTEAGEAVLASSKRVFEAVSALREDAITHLGGFRGPLRFACNQAVASKLIAPAITEMEAKHPGIAPMVRIGNTDEVQRWVDDRKVELGIVVDDGLVGKRYNTRRLYEGNLVIVQSPNLRTKNPFEALIVSRTEPGGLSDRFAKAYLRVYGERITPKIVVSGWQVILDLAVAGYGAALVPEFLCEEALTSGKLKVVRHRVKSVTFELCAIMKKGRAPSRNAEALLETLSAGTL